MKKLLALTALAAALTFAGTTDASARTQLQSANAARIAHQNFKAQQQTFALTGQTYRINNQSAYAGQAYKARSLYKTQISRSIR